MWDKVYNPYELLFTPVLLPHCMTSSVSVTEYCGSSYLGQAEPYKPYYNPCELLFTPVLLPHSITSSLSVR